MPDHDFDAPSAPPQPPPYVPDYAPLPPAVEAAAAEAPLPAPPPLPHQAGYYEEFQLARLLRYQRATAKTRANNAVLAMHLAGLALVLGAIFGILALVLGAIGGMAEGSEGADAASGIMVMLAVVIPLLAAVLIYGVVVLVTAHRVLPYHYRLAWQRFIHESDSILLVDEERLRIIQENLPGRFWGAATTKPHFSTLVERLEFGVFQLPSLRILARNPEKPPKALLRRAEMLRRNAGYFNNMAMVITCCVLGALSRYGNIFLISYGLSQGPRIVEAYARMLALIDMYLEEPEIDVRQLPPAPELYGWWATTTAPWFRQG